MPDEHNVHAHIAHHFGGHFACVGAFVGEAAHILGTNVDFVV